MDLLREPDVAACADAGLQIATPEIPLTGINGALRRTPKAESQSVDLLTTAGFVPSWKPYWPKVKTVGLTFPVVPKGDETIRFQINAAHTEGDIAEVLAALRELATK